MSRTLLRIALVAVVCVFPVACSGSSEGLSPLALTAQNAELVAGQAGSAVDLVNGMSELVEVFSDQVNGNQGAQTVIPCDSGNASFNVNDMAPLGQLSTGDSATFTFNACVLDFGGGLTLTLNGTLSFIVDDLTGAMPGPYSAMLSCNFGSFSVNTLGATVIINGGFMLDESTADGVSFSRSVSGTYFSSYAQGSGGQSFSGTLKNFAVVGTIDDSTGDYTYTVDAEISSSVIGGVVTYATTVTFTGTDPDDPSTGQLVITGASGSTVTLNAIDSVNVQIEVDVDGDGTPEATIDTTWAVLQS